MNKQININLSPTKNKLALQDSKIVKMFQLIAFTSLFIVVFLASGMLVLNNTSSLPFLKQQESTVLSQLTVLGSKTVKLYLIKDRLAFAHTILSEQTSYEQVLSDIKGQLPNDVAIASISVNQKTLTMTLTSPSLLSINMVLDNITDLISTKKRLRNVTVTAITLNAQDAKYTMVLDGILL